MTEIQVGDTVVRTGGSYNGLRANIVQGEHYVVAEIKNAEVRLEEGVAGTWWDIELFEFVLRPIATTLEGTDDGWWDVEAETVSVREPETGLLFAWTATTIQALGLELRVQLRRKP